MSLLSASRGRALCAEEREFGATAALWDMAGKLHLVETIDRHAPKRRQGASVGEYMLLATINRVVNPKSKREVIYNSKTYKKLVADGILTGKEEPYTKDKKIIIRKKKEVGEGEEPKEDKTSKMPRSGILPPR